MKLYIKQKVFSIGDKYDIYDLYENPVFQARGSLFALAAKFYLCDMAGNELFFIEKQLFSFLPRYNIFSGGNHVATIEKELTFFKPKLKISSVYGEIDIFGDLFSYDFDIKLNGRSIGFVSKQFLSWGDTYELDIPDNADQAFFVALVLAIDNALHNENK